MPAKSEQPIVCVIGLGYVGLPLAKEFSRHFKVIGFDTNVKLVKGLNLGNNNQNLTITDSPQQIKQADAGERVLKKGVTAQSQPVPEKREAISKWKHLVSSIRWGCLANEYCQERFLLQAQRQKS